MILSKRKNIPAEPDALVKDYIVSGRADKILILVPTNRKLRNLKKEIISLSPGKTVSEINLETLTTLSSRLLNQSERFHDLSEAASTILIKQSALEVEIKYFKAYRDEIPFGTLDRIKNVISEYKRHGITPPVLRAEAEKLDSAEKLKALDIAEIYEAYNKKCRNLNALEIGDVYNILDELDKNQTIEFFRNIFPSVEIVLLHGFDELTTPEVNLISKLSLNDDLDLYLNFDYYSGNKFIFSHLQKTYERLENKGFIKIDFTSTNTGSKFQKLVLEKLFQAKEEKISKYKENIFRLAAATREEEIILIAKEIKKILLNDEAEPHQICVAFNLIDKYSPIVRDIFRSYGIPFNLTDRISLNNSFPVIELINFLEILENDFFYKNIFRALSGGFIELNGIDLFNLKRAAANLKIVAGRENWIGSLRHASAALEYEEDISDKVLSLKKYRFEKAEKDIRQIYETLRVFDKKMTMREFITGLKDLAIKLNLHKNLLANAEGREEENIKAVSSFFETIEEIFELLKMEEDDETKYGLDFFLDQIRTASNWARFNVKEKSNFGVQVTTINEIRGLTFRHLFISGMTDGDFPTRYVPEIFFSGSFVKNENRHLTEQRYHFYQTLSVWKDRLYLTFPNRDNEKEMVESTFLKDFRNLFETTELTADDYDGYIFSNEEVLEFIGRRGFEISKDFQRSKIFEEIPSIKKLKAAAGIDKLRTYGTFKESAFNGYLFAADAGDISDPAKEKLDEMREWQYSISQLENYAKCPFKFFMERILKVDLLEEPTEEIEALELGSVLHSILYNFYTELRKRKIDLSDKKSYDFEEVKTLLFNIGERISDKVFSSSGITFFEREKIFGLGGDEKESILYKFLDTEINETDFFKPKYFEASFGATHRNETDEEISRPDPIEVAGVKLRGKIDRIEVDEETKNFNIVDYKLSKTVPPAKDYAAGISLQLPVYMRAAQLLLQDKYGDEFKPGKMFIYALKYSEGYFGKAQAIKKDQDLIINEVIAKVKTYVDNISEGRFNLSTLEEREAKVCRYCDFRSVCRIEEARNV